jgi:NADPH:quinone reductase-like Zn-dependent oxidoreductase
MRLLLKVLGILGVIVALAGVTMAILLSHNASCGTAPPLQGGAPGMKAAVARCYGPPTVITLEEVARPAVGDHDVLVAVRATSVNPYDWHLLRGSPYVLRLDTGLGRPKDVRLGVDFAGTVAAVGKDVTRFKPGDKVFGGQKGAFAQYVALPDDDSIALMPASVSFEEAAASVIAGITALQGIRDTAQVHAGDQVLINGASGGVGTFAVQIAKSLGAEVTGVCSTHNLDLVRSLGAAHVVDYTREDFTAGTARYDVILDNVGNHAFSDYLRVLKPQGRLLVMGGPKGDWIGPLEGFLKVRLMSPFVRQQKLLAMLADLQQDDLTKLAGLLQTGQVKVVIDRRYPLSEVPAAMTYQEAGHARGKVVIDLP